MANDMEHSEDAPCSYCGAKPCFTMSNGEPLCDGCAPRTVVKVPTVVIVTCPCDYCGKQAEHTHCRGCQRKLCDGCHVGLKCPTKCSSRPDGSPVR